MSAEEKFIAAARKIAAFDAANEGTQTLIIGYRDIMAMLTLEPSAVRILISSSSTREKIVLFTAYLWLLERLHQYQREFKEQLENPPDFYKQKALELFEFELGLVALGLTELQQLGDAKSSAPTITAKPAYQGVLDFFTKPSAQKAKKMRELAEKADSDAEKELAELFKNLKEFAREVLLNPDAMLSGYINPDYFSNDKAIPLMLPESCLFNLRYYAHTFIEKKGKDDYNTFLGKLEKLGSAAKDMEVIQLVVINFNEQFSDLLNENPVRKQFTSP